MDEFLIKLLRTEEETWLVITDKTYYSKIKNVDVEKQLVLFTYQIYSSSRNAYETYERLMPIELIDGIERRLNSIPAKATDYINKLKHEPN